MRAYRLDRTDVRQVVKWRAISQAAQSALLEGPTRTGYQSHGRLTLGRGARKKNQVAKLVAGPRSPGWAR